MVVSKNTTPLCIVKPTQSNPPVLDGCPTECACPHAQVSREQIYNDLGKDAMDKIVIEEDPYIACAGAHAIAILTEWDMFKTLDYKKIYESMQKVGAQCMTFTHPG